MEREPEEVRTISVAPDARVSPSVHSSYSLSPECEDTLFVEVQCRDRNYSDPKSFQDKCNLSEARNSASTLHVRIGRGKSPT